MYIGSGYVEKKCNVVERQPEKRRFKHGHGIIR